MDAQIFLKEASHRLRVAVGFLTVLPMGRFDYREGDLARSSILFPLVGLGIGLANLGAWTLVLTITNDRWVSALGVVVVWTALTRGLHLDGAADICDALWGGGNPEKRRTILQDSRLGTFGVAAVFFLLAGKLLFVAGLDRFVPLVLAPVAGRTAALFMGALFPPLPTGGKGLGSQLNGNVPQWYSGLWIAIVAGLGIGQDAWILLKIVATFIIIFLFGRLLVRQLGGVNGDGLGAGIEWTELFTLLLK